MSEAYKSISKGLREAIEYSEGNKKKPENLKSSIMKKEKKIQKVKNIPKFKNEEEEREFWAKNDSTDYVDWSKAKEVQFPSLKPSTQSISIRLPVSLLENLKVIANRMDVPYQSLIKVLLDESVKKKYSSVTQ